MSRESRERTPGLPPWRLGLRKLHRANPRLLILVFITFCMVAASHTLPISYLQLAADPDYLHLELIFNPFELAFVAEADQNNDRELDPEELRKSGGMVARRVAEALKITVAGRPVHFESAGMDPDMSGHHVRLRAHYKIDARNQSVTISSELNNITSSSHLVQVRFKDGQRQQLAQLDSRTKAATFAFRAPAETSAPALATPNKKDKRTP